MGPHPRQSLASSLSRLVDCHIYDRGRAYPRRTFSNSSSSATPAADMTTTADVIFIFRSVHFQEPTYSGFRSSFVSILRFYPVYGDKDLFRTRATEAPPQTPRGMQLKNEESGEIRGRFVEILDCVPKPDARDRAFDESVLQ